MSLLLPLTLASVLTTDPLGYECVPEEHLEVAFSLSGKGMRVPQTCITDPCAQTFSELTLASYSGYRDEAVYDDYRRRMTSVCGAPTQWDDIGIDRDELIWAVFDGGDEDIVTHNPIPAPLLLLASATGGLVLLRRVRKT